MTMATVAPDSTIPSGGCSPYQFGAALAAHQDELLVGAPYRYYASRADEGIPPPVAGLFRRTAGAWALAEQLTATEPIRSEGFARSVALGASFAIVGAPGYESGDGPAHEFARASGVAFQWSAALDSPARSGPDGELFAEYGAAVAADDELVFVGAPLDQGAPTCDGCGAVYVFERRSRALVATLRAARPQENFGSALALADDLLVIGAPAVYSNEQLPGAAYVYRRHGPGQWRELCRVEGRRPGEQFGAAVSIHDARVAIGAPGRADLPKPITGRVELFALTPTGCTRTAAIEEAATFGAAVALSSDRLAIGQPGFEAPGNPPQTGRVGLYRVSADGASLESWLTAPGSPEYARVGSSAALGPDYVAAGAPGLGEDDDGAGFVIVKAFAPHAR